MDGTTGAILSNNMLEKRNFNEFKNLYKNEAISPNHDNLLNEEYETNKTLRVFKVKDSNKNRFAESLAGLDSSEFSGFNSLFNLLETIIKD